MLTDEQINEIVREAARGSATRRDGSTSMRIARAVEAAVLEAQGKQEPVAWVYYPKGVGEKYVTYTNPASLNLGKQADRIAYIQPLYAAPVVQPDDLKDAARYRMLRNGEYWPAAFYDHDEPEPLRGQELDAAIDAVMAAEKAQK